MGIATSVMTYSRSEGVFREQTLNKRLFLVLGDMAVILGASGLWDLGLNHNRDSNYCLPFCLWNPEKFIAADFLFTMIMLGLIVLALSA